MSQLTKIPIWASSLFQSLLILMLIPLVWSVWSTQVGRSIDLEIISHWLPQYITYKSVFTISVSSKTVSINASSMLRRKTHLRHKCDACQFYHCVLAWRTMTRQASSMGFIVQNNADINQISCCNVVIIKLIQDLLYLVIASFNPANSPNGFNLPLKVLLKLLSKCNWWF